MISYNYPEKGSRNDYYDNVGELVNNSFDDNDVVIQTLNNESYENFETVFFMNDNLADGLLAFCIQAFNLTLNFNIVGSTTSKKYGVIYSNRERKILLIKFENTIREDIAFNVTYSLLNPLTLSNMFVFSSLYMSRIANFHQDSYTGYLHDGALRQLANDTFKQTIHANTINTIPILEIGNIVSNIEAAIMNYTFARNISSCIFISYREASLTMNAAKAYEKTLPLIKSIFQSTNFSTNVGTDTTQGGIIPDIFTSSNVDNKISLDKKYYEYITKGQRDVFKFNTELLYT